MGSSKPPSGVSRVHRLIRLITLMQSNKARNATDLTLELGVSRRTLFRDLKLLEAAGVPYYHERGKGYRIRQSFFLPPINLSMTETLGLMVLAKRAEADRSRPLAAAALSAVYKLIASVPDPIREACGDLIKHISIDPGRTEDGTSESRIYIELQHSIDQQLACEVVYQPPRNAPLMRTILRPYALHLANNAWYVLGTTDMHGPEVRVFKLVRFQSVTPTRQRFKKPDGFRVRDKLGNAWRLNPEGQEYDVCLEFSEQVATNVAEVRWHHTQQTERLEDGGCRVRFRIDGLREIAWWVCGYADQCRVVSPSALAAMVQNMHQNALNHCNPLQ